MVTKYIITSAQSYASPHKRFLDGLDEYSIRHHAQILILPMIGNSARQDWDKLHERFSNYEVVTGRKKLNNNLQIEQFHVRPYQIDPLTGLSRFAQRETTQIFASPKQRLKAISHSNHKLPKFLATTGACTYPNYATGEDVSAERRRLGGIATRDHVYGALIIEVISRERYHLRNIRGDSKGRFVDLGEKYDGRKVTKSKLEALVFGDWHVGYIDPYVRRANYQQIRELKPERIFLHDFFDGHCVSHHRDGYLITQKILEGADKNFLSLEQELGTCHSELLKLSKAMKGRDIYIVASNHHEFLDKYLDEGRFIQDAENARIAFELAQALANRINPIEYGIYMFGELPSNIHFLKREDDYKIKGYQLASHGDKGPSGGRGSIISKENDYGKSITGHTHSSEILRDTYIVGTSTPLTIFYNLGNPTSWTNSNAALWDNSTVQMIHAIKGKWRSK